MNDLSKLPKWARTHIESLEREVRVLAEENATMRHSDEVKNTNVFLRNYGQRKDIPLPPDSVIVFKTGEQVGDYIEAAFDRKGSLTALDNTGKAVQIRAGNGAVVVVPSARNVIHVKQE